MKIQQGLIKVKYKSTSDPSIASQWLEELPSLFAADFEAAVKYADDVVENAKEQLKDTQLSKKELISYKAIAEATPLGHPSHSVITHCSVAWSREDAYVIIIDSEEILKVVLDFLVATEKTQVWHNYGYDGKLIRYFKKKDVKNVEDSQIRAKCLMNHVEVYKANTGLKELMGEHYGDWGIDTSLFHKSQMYEDKMIKYSATDACATYYLWEKLNVFTEST